MAWTVEAVLRGGTRMVRVSDDHIRADAVLAVEARTNMVIVRLTDGHKVKYPCGPDESRPPSELAWLIAGAVWGHEGEGPYR